MQRLILQAVTQQLESDGYFLVEEYEHDLIYQHPRGGPSGTVTIRILPARDDGKQYVVVHLGRPAA